MDREIKFRVWEKNHKKWIDDFAMFLTTGELLKYDRKAGGEYETVMRTEEAMKELLDYDYKSIEVMQYTGLIDRYGKEIYEGDILKSLLDDRWFDWLVSFNEGAFIVQNIGVDGYLMDEYRLTSSMAMDRLVIGNIYENPELLKQQEVKND